MARNWKLRLCVGTATSAALLYGSHGFAQEAAPPAVEQATSIEEVVVISRGRAEQLRDVPISATAFSEGQIERAKIRAVSDFIGLTPNITIVEAQNAGYSAVSIRGITQVRNSQSPVAVVVDGVQQVNSYQLTQQLFDLAGIEVLRGPQGALYGRNAEGGAILITTKQPTNQAEGHFVVGAGSGREYSAQGVVSGPLVQDRLFGRLGATWVDRKGYFDNVYLNRKQDPYEDFTVQGLLKWTPTEKFSADLKASYSVTDGGALNYHFQGAVLLPNGLINPANPVDFTRPGDANLVDRKFISRDIGTDHRTIADVSLKLSYDLGFATLRSISAWSRVEELYTGDGYPYGNTTTIRLIPGTDLFDVAASATQYLDVDAKSQELRLTSPNDQRFRWMVGGYYLSTDRYISTTTGFNNGLGILKIERTPAGAGSINPTLSFLGDDNHNVTYAGFANFDFDVTEQLQLSAAFRYDEDRRTQHVSRYNTSGAPGATNKATFTQGQPKFTAVYKATPSLNLYGSWGVGFRSGEFNQNGAAAAAAAAGTVGIVDKVPQEKAETSEIGFKGSWLENRLRISGDIYQTNVTNQQYFVFIGSIAAQVLVPVDRVRLRGGELEVAAALAPGLQLSAGLGVTDSKIRRYTVNPANVGNRAPYVPDMTLNLGLEYRKPIGDRLILATRADYRRLGRQYWDTDNSTPRDPVDLVALSVGLEDADGRWTASVKADNLFDERYNAEYVAGGYVQPANPRIIRATVRVNF